MKSRSGEATMKNIDQDTVPFTRAINCWFLSIVLPTLVLSACAAPGDNSPNGFASVQARSGDAKQSSNQQPHAIAPDSQVLLIVRLKDRNDLPQALALDYAGQNDASLQSSVGMLQRGLSGQYGDYPILLKLKAGGYQLKSLRVAGRSRNENGCDADSAEPIF